MAATQKVQNVSAIISALCLALMSYAFMDVRDNSKAINENRGTIIELAQKQIAIKDSVMTHYTTDCHISSKDMKIYFHEMKDSGMILSKE